MAPGPRLDPNGLAEDPASGRKNPIVAFLDAMTPAEEAALRELGTVDYEDPSALVEEFG